MKPWVGRDRGVRSALVLQQITMQTKTLWPWFLLLALSIPPPCTSPSKLLLTSCLFSRASTDY